MKVDMNVTKHNLINAIERITPPIILFILLLLYIFGFGWSPDGFEWYKLIDVFCIVVILLRFIVNSYILNLRYSLVIFLGYSLLLVDQVLNFFPLRSLEISGDISVFIVLIFFILFSCLCDLKRNFYIKGNVEFK